MTLHHNHYGVMKYRPANDMLINVNWYTWDVPINCCIS